MRAAKHSGFGLIILTGLVAASSGLAYRLLAPTSQQLTTDELRIGRTHDVEVDHHSRVRATGVDPYFLLELPPPTRQIDQFRLTLSYQDEPGDRGWDLFYIAASAPSEPYSGTRRIAATASSRGNTKTLTWRLPEPATSLRVDIPRWSEVELESAMLIEAATAQQERWRQRAGWLAVTALLSLLLGLGWLALRRLQRPVHWLAFNVVGTLVLALACEGLLAWLYHHPPESGAWQQTLRRFYLQQDRNIVQLTSTGAMYDKELTYRLRPGHFNFANVEFDTSFEVNSAGLRDDEESLDQPQIIILGDSQAMGWGVEQGETFASLLQAQTGQRVLNAAVSSYGTVRELRLLNQLDRRRLHTLIVQYCDNDFFENGLFARRNDLPIRSRERYLEEVAAHQRRAAYSPFKLTRFLVPALLRGLPRQAERGAPVAEEVAAFLATWRAHAEAIPSTARVLLLEVSAFEQLDDRFGQRLEQTLQDDPEWRDRITIVPVANGLRSEHFYRLDDHLRPSGHAYVAEQLLGALGSRG